MNWPIHYSKSWSGEIFESLPALWEWATWIVDLNRRLQQQEDGKVFTWQKQRVFLLSQITPSTFARTDWDGVMWLGGAAVHIVSSWERKRATMYNVQRWERQKRSAHSYSDLSLSSCRKHFCNLMSPSNQQTQLQTRWQTHWQRRWQIQWHFPKLRKAEEVGTELSWPPHSLSCTSPPRIPTRCISTGKGGRWIHCAHGDQDGFETT